MPEMIVNRVEELLASKGLTLKDLYKARVLAPNTVYSMKNPDWWPRASTVEYLCELLDCQISDFLYHQKGGKVDDA